MAKKILTVEDSKTLRDGICRTLRSAGYEVIEAENGRDALSKLNCDAVDFILTDLNMPQMNGIEFTQELRSRSDHKYTPVYFLTTETKSMMRQIAKVAGASGWLVKPFEQNQLLKIVRDSIG